TRYLMLSSMMLREFRFTMFHLPLVPPNFFPLGLLFFDPGLLFLELGLFFLALDLVEFLFLAQECPRIFAKILLNRWMAIYELLEVRMPSQKSRIIHNGGMVLKVFFGRRILIEKVI